MLSRKIDQLKNKILQRKIRLSVLVFVGILFIGAMYSGVAASPEEADEDNALTYELNEEMEDNESDEQIYDEELDEEELDEEDLDEFDIEDDVQPEEIVPNEIDNDDSINLEEGDLDNKPLYQPVGSTSIEFAYGRSETVTDWNQLKAAIADNDVSEIILANDISRTSTARADMIGSINRSLRIDGAGNTLIQNNGYNLAAAREESPLLLNSPQNTGAAVLEIENLNYEKNYGPNESLVKQSSNVTGWTIRLINVNSTDSNTSGLVDASNAEIIVKEGSDLTIKATGQGSVFRANTMTIENDAAISVNYSSPSSNPSVFYTSSLVLEKDAEIISKTDGAMYNIRSNYIEMKEESDIQIDTTGSSNAAIYMENSGSFRMTGANLHINNVSTKGSTTAVSGDSATAAGGIYGKIQEITFNNSRIDMEVNAIAFKTSVSCNFTVGGGSVFDILSHNAMGIGMYDGTGDGNGSNTNNLIIKDSGTIVTVDSRSTTIDAAGCGMYIRGANSTVQILDHANFSIRADNGTTNNNSAFQMQGDNSIIKVHNKAVMKLSAAKSSVFTSPVLRFRYVGGMTLDIDDGEVHIESDGGSASGIRMYGAGNSVYVKNGGYLYIHLPGSGTASNGGDGVYNMAIHYSAATSNVNGFYLEGRNGEGVGSTVEIISESGPAIYASNSRPMEIHAGEGTIFEAYGRTSSSTNGIFNSSGALNIEINEPEYFDFKNGNMARPAINASASSSTFDAENTTFSLWTTGSDWNLSPTVTLRKVTHMNLKGSNYATIADVDSRVSDVFNSNTYKNITNYNRISSNNARPIVDELRIGTDADQYIYGHVSIPEGRDVLRRDAWTNEAYVIAEVYDSNGVSLYGQLKGTTQGMNEEESGISVFDIEEERGGIFEIKLPDGKYLEEGQRIAVTGAWRGDDANTIELAMQNDRNVISRNTDIEADDKIAQHVTPPTTIAEDDLDANVLTEIEISSSETKKVLTTRTKKLSGVSSEIGSTVHVYQNDVLISDGTDTVQADGTWEVEFDSSIDLNEGDIVAVSLNDKHPALQLEDKDQDYLTAKTLIHGGNEKISQNVKFHNKEFAKRLELEVVYFGNIVLVTPDTLNFDIQKITSVEKKYKATGVSADDLGVLDTRKERSDWKLYLTLDKQMTHINDNTLKLQDSLVYMWNNNEITLTEGTSSLVCEGKNDDDFYDIYSQLWYGSSGDGLYLNVKPGIARVGEYTGEITWTLHDTP